MKKILLFCLCVLCSVHGSAKKLPLTYGFFHELSDWPRYAPTMVGPMINLLFLDQVVKQKGTWHRQLQTDVYDLGGLPLLTRKEWAAQMHAHRMGWYYVWAALNDEAAKKPKPTKYTDLISYLNDAVESAPVMPHVYDKKRRSVAALHEARVLAPDILAGVVKRRGEIESAPFCFLDHDVIEKHMLRKPKFALTYLGSLLQMGLDFHGATIPLYGNKRWGKWHYQLYYKDTVQGRQVIKVNDLGDTIQKALNKYSPRQGMWYHASDVLKKNAPNAYDDLVELVRKRLRLTRIEAERMLVLWRPRKKLRGNKIRELEFDVVGGLDYTGGYRKGNKTYIPIKYGLYKLMLLFLELNDENKAIQKGDQEWNVAQDLRRLVKETSPNHSWLKLSKDNFLNYEIAEVLKEDRGLFERVRRVIDFSLKPLREFEKLLLKKKYYRQDKKLGFVPFEKRDVKNFVPGIEQALAMMLIEAVHYLWVYACWYKRAYKFGPQFIFELGSRFWRVGWLINMHTFVDRASKRFRAYPRRKGAWRFLDFYYWIPRRASFFEIWGQVVNALQNRWRRGVQKQRRDNWIAFDGKAGFVMSFDPLLLKMQRALPIVSKKILDELKFSAVDHYYSVPLFTEEQVTEFWKYPFVK